MSIEGNNGMQPTPHHKSGTDLLTVYTGPNAHPHVLNESITCKICGKIPGQLHYNEGCHYRAGAREIRNITGGKWFESGGIARNVSMDNGDLDWEEVDEASSGKEPISGTAKLNADGMFRIKGDAQLGGPWRITASKIDLEKPEPYVSELLRKHGELYAERNAVYGDNFKMVGKLMAAMFPDGPPELKDEHDYNRWHLFELAIVKLSRYAINYNNGGHVDSLDDMIVYLAMVAERDREAGHRD